jgi:hypothetical protein
MLNTFFVAVVAVSAVWIYLDATKNKIGKISYARSLFNISAGAWGVVTFGLWIIAFPAYLIKRNDLIRKAKENPIEVKNRGGKAAALLIIGGLWVLISLDGIEPSPEAQAEECINSHAVTLAQQYTDEDYSSEVMGYSDTKILRSPKKSGYHLLDFNVRLLIKAESGGYSQQENISVKGFKCFHDNTKYEDWKLNKNS